MTILKNIKDMILEQIQNKANRSELPTRVSDLDNDLNLITEEDISGKADINSLSNVAFSGDYDDLSNKPNIPTKTSDLTNDSNFLTEHQDISGKANTNALSDVAFSGDYNDLINKPSTSSAEHEHDIADIEGVEVVPVIITYTDNSTENRNLLFYTPEE